jgi:hypothetical protein
MEHLILSKVVEAKDQLEGKSTRDVAKSLQICLIGDQDQEERG